LAASPATSIGPATQSKGVRILRDLADAPDLLREPNNYSRTNEDCRSKEKDPV